MKGTLKCYPTETALRFDEHYDTFHGMISLFHCLIFLQYNSITFSSSSKQNKYHSGHTSKYSVKLSNKEGTQRTARFTHTILCFAAQIFLFLPSTQSHLLLFFSWCFCFWMSIDLTSFCQNKTLCYTISLINQVVTVGQTKMKAKGYKTIKPKVR